MFKKFLLIAFVFYSELIQTKHSEEFIGVVAAGIAAGCGISYWHNRESNEIKRLRALDLCKMYEEKLHAALVNIKEPQDVVHFVSQSSDVLCERKKLAFSIGLSAREMESRYDHPFKPWNWSDDMKEMFERIQAVHSVTRTVTIMYRYQSLFEILVQNTKPSVKQEAIIDDILDSEKIKSPYPMSAYVDNIQKDIDTLTLARDRCSVEDGRCAYVLIGMLREIHNSIVQSNEYMEEMRYKKERSFKKHQTVVSEVQAKVKRAQNFIQRRQAEAELEQWISDNRVHLKEAFKRQELVNQEQTEFNVLEQARAAEQYSFMNSTEEVSSSNKN